MRILIAGSGAREHALAWRLAKEGHEVFALPGNPGISQVATCFEGPFTHQRVIQVAKDTSPHFVLIGPEDPLIDGLADFLRDNGHLVVGPNKAGAQLEGSKAFSKDLMRQAKVRTAAFRTFDDSFDAIEYANSRYAKGIQVVVKASGAALGKGVTVCDTYEEAVEAIRDALERKVFGAAGSTIVVEDRLVGPEYSLLTICSEEGIFSFPPAQDHKRIFDGDKGPNTGGMGTYSPLEFVDSNLVHLTEVDLVKPILSELRANGIPFRGILFTGVMLHDGEPYCLEYNVRFGDPETQTVMMRIASGLGEALLASAKGGPIPPVAMSESAAVTVVAASGGYPGPVEKGKPIQIGEMPVGVQVFHAGTAVVNGQLVTNGGRVLGVSAAGMNFQEARQRAYAGMEQISFEGKQFRSDIGKSAMA